MQNRDAKPKQNIRVLIADDEALLSERLIEYLNSKGFDTHYVTTGAEAKKIIQAWKPDFVLFDLMLPDMNALEFLRYLKQANLLGEDKIKVFVTSGHNNPQNVKECSRQGASDFIVKPIKNPELFARMVLHMQTKREVPEFSPRTAEDLNSAQYYMHLTDLTLRESLKKQAPEDCLHNLTGLLGVSMKAVRVSLVRCDADIRKGWVMASSDKRAIGGLEIDLFKYPEIVYVLQNDKLLALDNIVNDPTMHFVSRQQKEISFNSMVVCPVRIAGQNWGVVSIRMPETKTTLGEFEIRYAQLASHVMAHVVRNAPEILTKGGFDPEATSAA